MPQEQPWWRDEEYIHSDVERVVAEATRRGIEQGKREAWEEVYKHCSEEKEQRSKAAKKFRDCSQSHLELMMQGMAVAYSQLAASAHVSLSSLSKSSNENV